MRQSLQNKVNLLGSLFVAFFLLMLPMCTQVRADTKDSMKQASDTWLVQQIRKLTKSGGTPKDIGDADVEDVWRKRVHEQNPDCGPECDPDADYDGDGMSNYDEHVNGRNPWCNEEKDPTCKDKDPEKPVDPPQPPTPRNHTEDDLFDRTFDADFSCPGTPQDLLSDQFCTSAAFTISPGKDYDDLVFYLNITGFNGRSWRVEYSNATGVHAIGADNCATVPGPCPYPARPYAIVDVPRPGADTYTVSLSARADAGQFEIHAYGIVR